MVERRARRGSSWHPPRGNAVSSIASAPSLLHSARKSGADGFSAARGRGEDLEEGLCDREPGCGIATRCAWGSPRQGRHNPEAHSDAREDVSGVPPVSFPEDRASGDECFRLRAELAAQQKEAQRLRMHMQHFEVAQPQGQNIDQALQDLKAALVSTAGQGGLEQDVGERVIDVLTNMANVKADVSQQMEARDQEWQQHLQDKLTEQRQENERLAAKVKGAERGGAGSTRQKSARSKLAMYEGEAPLEEQKRINRELHKRLQKATTRLEEEAAARREQELAAHRLAGALQESRSRQKLSKAREAARKADVEVGVPPAIATKASVQPAVTASSSTGGACSSTVQAFRQDLDELRSQERALRAAGRRGRNLEVAEVAAEGALETAAVLRSELLDAQLKAEFLEEQRESLEEQLLQEQAAAQEALLLESDWREEAELAEARAWMLTEVANEVALQADLQCLAYLEGQAQAQRRLQAAEVRCELAEQRCILLEAVADQAAAGARQSPQFEE